jgi:hypothetical protein
MRMPDLPRRTTLATVAIVIGLVVIGVAAFGGSGSSSKSGSGSDTKGAVKPVAPIDPDDQDAERPKEEEPVDLTDPFASGYGAKGRHRVKIRVSGNGYVNIAVSWRDRQDPKELAARSHSETRTVKGKYPLAFVAMQLPGNLPGGASSATCTIEIDGVQVAKVTTRKKGALKACIG